MKNGLQYIGLPCRTGLLTTVLVSGMQCDVILRVSFYKRHLKSRMPPRYHDIISNLPEEVGLAVQFNYTADPRRTPSVTSVLRPTPSLHVTSAK